MNATGTSTAIADCSSAGPLSDSLRKSLCSVGRMPYAARPTPGRSDLPTPALCRPVLHELPPEPALDTKIADGDRIVERRRRLHDDVVLHVQRERTANA